MAQSVSATPTDAIPASKANAAPPYRLYAAIFGLFIAVRFGDLLVRDMEWTVWVHQSKTGWYLSIALAVLLSAITARYLKPRVAHLLAWLMCGFVGTSCMLLTSSFAGMLVGFAVGGVLVFRESIYSSFHKVDEAFPWIGSCGRVLYRFVVRVVQLFYIPVCVGLLAGAVIAFGFVSFGQWSDRAVVPVFFFSAALGFVLFVAAMCRVWKSRASGGRKWPRWYEWTWAVPVFLLFVIAGSMLTYAMDSHLRRSRLGPGVRTHSGGLLTAVLLLWPDLLDPQQIMNSPRLQQVLQAMVPIEAATQGLHTGHVYLGAWSSDADLKVVGELRLLTAMVIESNSGVTDAGLKKLSLPYLINLHVQRETKITDEGFADIDKSNLQMLTLEGKNFSDEALIGIDQAHRLSHLSMPGTTVTSQGLGRLNHSAPIYYLDVHDTLVDDAVFETLARMPMLRFVNLSGTRVTGKGLGQLRATNIQYLNLDNTQFDERYLADLLPSEEGKESLAIGGLGLRGVPISKAGIETISRINGLGDLDLRGSKIDAEAMKLLQKLPLSTLAVDGGVQPEVLSLVNWATQLRLDYDAELTTPNEIRKHCEQTVKFVPPTANIAATIRNLTLTEANVKQILFCFRKAGTGSWTFNFENAIDPDQEGNRTQAYNGRFQFASVFREWNAEVLKAAVE